MLGKGVRTDLRGQELHAYGASGQHIASCQYRFDDTDEGRGVRKLVVKQDVQQDVVHTLCLLHLLEVFIESTVWIHPGERKSGDM